MIADLLETTALLSVLAALPVMTVAGLRPASVFLCPLGGALLGAWAAQLELVAGGSFASALLILAAVANGATLIYLVSRRRKRPPLFVSSPAHERILSVDSSAPQSRGWQLISFMVLALAVLYPLRALGAAGIGFDANVSWLTHSMLVHGGHETMLSWIHNPVFVLNHADYPPLVPATSAVGYVVSRDVDLQVGIGTTAMLNACAIGVLGSGISEIAGRGVEFWRRMVVLALAGAVCLVGFGIAGPTGINGFVDLTWAALAAAAVVFGLVLPRSSQRLWVAWICLTAAALAKNEGTVAAVIVSAAIAVRYVDAGLRTPVWTWMRRAAVMCVLVIPGLTWSAIIRHYNIKSSVFFDLDIPGQPPIDRLGHTLTALTEYLHVAPVALGVLAVGSLALRSRRRLQQLGSALFLWGVAFANLVVLVGTYVVGGYEIHWWLSSSLERTTIFTQLILYVDLAIWAAVALLPPMSAHGQPGGRLGR